MTPATPPEPVTALLREALQWHDKDCPCKPGALRCAVAECIDHAIQRLAAAAPSRPAEAGVPLDVDSAIYDFEKACYANANQDPGGSYANVAKARRRLDDALRAALARAPREAVESLEPSGERTGLPATSSPPSVVPPTQVASDGSTLTRPEAPRSQAVEDAALDAAEVAVTRRGPPPYDRPEAPREKAVEEVARIIFREAFAEPNVVSGATRAARAVLAHLAPRAVEPGAVVAWAVVDRFGRVVASAHSRASMEANASWLNDGPDASDHDGRPYIVRPLVYGDAPSAPPRDDGAAVREAAGGGKEAM